MSGRYPPLVCRGDLVGDLVAAGPQHVSDPASTHITPKAVPHDPAPITATLLMVDLSRPVG
jgi:hypothetical protein